MLKFFFVIYRITGFHPSRKINVQSREVIYASKYRLAFTAVILRIFNVAQLLNVRIFYTEFHPNRLTNMKFTDINLFTPFSKLCATSLFSQTSSCNTNFCIELLYRISYFLQKPKNRFRKSVCSGLEWTHKRGKKLIRMFDSIFCVFLVALNIRSLVYILVISTSMCVFFNEYLLVNQRNVLRRWRPLIDDKR
jgi:hypothetical protein